MGKIQDIPWPMTIGGLPISGVPKGKSAWKKEGLAWFTAASTLLRARPPLCNASILSASQVISACAFLLTSLRQVSSSEGVKNTDIGLSIVKKITELNGRSVFVESEIGKGSKFVFMLPKLNSNVTVALTNDHDTD